MSKKDKPLMTMGKVPISIIHADPDTFEVQRTAIEQKILRDTLPSPTLTVEVTYEGVRYQGTLYPVKDGSGA